VTLQHEVASLLRHTATIFKLPYAVQYYASVIKCYCDCIFFWIMS